MLPIKSSARPWPLWASEAQKLQSVLEGMEGFMATQACWNAGYTRGLAVDEKARKLCLFNADKGTLHRQVAGYQDIVSVELIQDGVTLKSTLGTSTSRTNGRSSMPGTGRPGQASPHLAGHSVGVVALKLTVAVKSLEQDGKSAQVLPSATTLVPALPSTPADNQPGCQVHIIKLLDKKVSRDSRAHQAALDKAGHWFKVIFTLQSIGSMSMRPAPLNAVPSPAV